jgi:hypothetical protein
MIQLCEFLKSIAESYAERFLQFTLNGISKNRRIISEQNFQQIETKLAVDDKKVPHFLY